MNLETWQATNSRYLAIAGEWLRLRLMRLAALNTDQPSTVEQDRVEVASA